MMQMFRLMTVQRPHANFSQVDKHRVFNDIELAAHAMSVGVPVAASIVFFFGIFCLGFLGYKAMTWRAPA
jgi:hypothetical protein